MFKFICSFTAIAIILFTINISPVNATENRTSARTVTGDIHELRQGSFPIHLSPRKKKSYNNWSFRPKTDPRFYKYRHQQQWSGMEWDPSLWTDDVTDESVLRSMYQSDIFRRQYVSKKDRPVVEVGPKFYKLSDLDRRRSLKLIADYFEFFENGFVAFEVRDWRKSKKIGEYTRYGFQPE